MHTQWKAPRPKQNPRRKQDKDMAELAKLAWQAGIIAEWRWGLDTNSPAVSPGEASGQTGWTVDNVWTADVAVARACVEWAVAEAGIVDLTWGRSWCGRRDVIVTRAVEVAA